MEEAAAAREDSRKALDCDDGGSLDGFFTRKAVVAVVDWDVGLFVAVDDAEGDCWCCCCCCCCGSDASTDDSECGCG